MSGTGEGSYEDYVDTEGYEELADVLVEIDDKINGEGIFASMAEIDDYNTKLDRAYSKMMSGGIDFSTASKDTPVDATNLIINRASRNGLMTKVQENGRMNHLQMVGRQLVVRRRVD